MDVSHHFGLDKGLSRIGTVALADLAAKVAACTDYRHALEVLPETLKGLASDPNWLDIEDFVAIARHYRQVELDPAIFEPESLVNRSYRELRGYMGEVADENGRMVPGNDPAQIRKVYGVNTGFGSFRKFFLDGAGQPGRLSLNILLSHATGTGRPLPVEIVRGMLLLRLRTFAQGVSGVRIVLLQKLVEMLNKGVVPYIPEKGSVGSSGDLAPLSHMFLVLLGRGQAWVIDPQWIEKHPERAAQLFDDNLDGRERAFLPGESSQHRLDRWQSDRAVLLTGAEAMQCAGITPLGEHDLEAKDGLALTNGAVLSAATLAIAVSDAENLYRTANLTGALTLQSTGGLTRAMEIPPHAVRPQLGQLLTGFEMLRLLRGSTMVNRSAYLDEAQDDYSIRAIPQVHGASLDTILHTRRVAELEINSVTDNPLFFRGFLADVGMGFAFGMEGLDQSVARRTMDTYHCSAANFHGQPVAIALDCLKIAVAELASIAERRIQLLYDNNHNRSLPANLTMGQAGLHSGFMIFQYTAASLVSENKVLCHPSSVDSIPTSANAEDHVSMATNAARHTRMVLRNTTDVLAIELLSALQAVDLRTVHTGWLKQCVKQWLADMVKEHPGMESLPESQLLTEYLKRGRNLFLFPALENEGQPSDIDMLTDTSKLKLSPVCENTRRIVRDILGVPFVGLDSAESGEAGAFSNHEPSHLAATLSAAIRSGSFRYE